VSDPPGAPDVSPKQLAPRFQVLLIRVGQADERVGIWLHLDEAGGAREIRALAHPAQIEALVRVRARDGEIQEAGQGLIFRGRNDQVVVAARLIGENRIAGGMEGQRQDARQRAVTKRDGDARNQLRLRAARRQIPGWGTKGAIALGPAEQFVPLSGESLDFAKVG
jgi:hypothetical protein